MSVRPEASDASSRLSGNSSDYYNGVPVSPTRAFRRPPSPIRLTSIGINPARLIGKVVTGIRRSSEHPALTLDFADKTTFQIRVDGYDPVHRGMPKVLEMDTLSTFLTNTPKERLSAGFTIIDCLAITLLDRAFEQRQKGRQQWEESWNQKHLAVVFKFAEESRWHCVSAMMFQEVEGRCVYRNFDDVYIQQVQRPARRHRKSFAQQRHAPH